VVTCCLLCGRHHSSALPLLCSVTIVRICDPANSPLVDLRIEVCKAVVNAEDVPQLCAKGSGNRARSDEFVSLEVHKIVTGRGPDTKKGWVTAGSKHMHRAGRPTTEGDGHLASSRDRVARRPSC
jgi:hypothetical protein